MRSANKEPWHVQPGALGVVGLLIVATLLLGLALQPLAVDDAYVTFRLARNLASGKGFTYNAGQAILSTTAPMYALILSAGARLGPDLPSLANALSAMALGTGAILLFALGRREGHPGLGALAGLFYVLYPLLWLCLGLETGFFLALGLAAILSYRSGRPYLAAILLALATLTRGDGLILAGVLALDWASGWSGWGRLLRGRAAPADRPGPAVVVAAAAVYVMVMVPLLAWLTWRFGSPVPATLATKQAQVELGISGFYAHTTYLEGIGLLVRARVEQSLLYLLFVPAVMAGVVSMWQRARWLRLIAGWGLPHLAAYSALGVTPYYWYYAPAVVALLCLAAAGVVEGARWAGRWASRDARLVRLGFGGLWALGLVVALVGSDWAMIQALEGPVPPPDDLVSKVLPEAKAGVYAQAGQWLATHTPQEATVGVTEVGSWAITLSGLWSIFWGCCSPRWPRHWPGGTFIGPCCATSPTIWH
ncbi:MAG: hypothetical protein M8467_19775 [Anaerolineae bacterium]|nr:hypothetical protein [Anaerolineae bacterium]